LTFDINLGTQRDFQSGDTAFFINFKRVMETKSRRPSILDILVRYLTFFYLIFVIIGYLSSYLYYIQFRIDISSYFTLEDYITSFFDVLPGLIIGALTLLILGILNYNKIKKAKARIESHVNDENITNTIYSQIDEKNLNSFRWALIVSTICFAIIILVLIFTRSKLFFLFLILSIWFVCFSGVFTLIYFLKVNKALDFNFEKISIIAETLLFILFIQCGWGTLNGFFTLKSSSWVPKTTININSGESINSSDSILFLGVSKDYVFLYDKLDQKSIVFNRLNIISIESEQNK